MEYQKLEIMLLHLLNSRTKDGKIWEAITIPGLGRFTRKDVEYELRKARTHWWEFWKR